MKLYRINDIAISAGVSTGEIKNVIRNLGIQPDRRGMRQEPYFTEAHFTQILREVGKQAAAPMSSSIDSESW